MLPLLPAHCRSEHSIQGQTFHNGIVLIPGSRFFAGDYVGVSRATEMKLITLTKGLVKEHFQGHPTYRLKVMQEYYRLAIKFNKSSYLGISAESVAQNYSYLRNYKSNKRCHTDSNANIVDKESFVYNKVAQKAAVVEDGDTRRHQTRHRV